MRMEPMRVLVLNQKSGLILNGAAEFELRPVIEALDLKVVHGWRIRSAHLLGHDCALIRNNFFPIRKQSNSHEFVDFEAQIELPALPVGRVLEVNGIHCDREVVRDEVPN